MKYNYFIFLTIMLGLFICIPSVNAENLQIDSNSAILYNFDDEGILYIKNEKEKIKIGTLSRLMTALIVIENNADLEKTISFEASDYADVEKNNLSSYDRNKKYTYYDFLHSLILENAIDCENALIRASAKNKEEFTEMMNLKAKQLKMINTHFDISNSNSYSTVEDLGIILKQSRINENLHNILTTFEYIASDNRTIYHSMYKTIKKHNIYMPYLKGGMIGNVSDEGYYSISISYNDENEVLMALTTKAENELSSIKDTKSIYDYHFNKYSYATLFKKNDTLVTLKAKHTNKNSIDIKAKEDIFIYIENGYKDKDIKTVYVGKKNVTPRDSKNENLGKLNIYYKDKLIKTVDVTLDQELSYSYTHIIVSSIFILLSVAAIIFLVRGNRK